MSREGISNMDLRSDRESILESQRSTKDPKTGPSSSFNELGMMERAIRGGGGPEPGPTGSILKRRLRFSDDDEDDPNITTGDVQYKRTGGILFSDDDEPPQIHLSVCWTGGKLGAAYYDSNTCQVHVLNDTLDVAPEFVILGKVISVSNPAVIVASAKQDERWLSALKLIVAGKSTETPITTTTTTTERSSSDGDEATVSNAGPVVHLVPSVDFDIGGARARIVNLNLPSMQNTITESDRIIFISSLINFDNLSAVRALGALLKYLDRKRINVELEDYSIKSPIVSINTFSMQGLVMVDEDTYRALQIFQKEWHPSVYKMASGMKEGLSLFGIFNQCKSTIGSKELQMWFLRPTRDAEVLRNRQVAIAFAVDISNADVVATLQNSLKQVRNASKILANMSIGQSSVADWQTLYKTVYNAIRIGETCRSLPQSIDIFQKISNTFTSELVEMASLMCRIIDFEESQSQNRFVANYGIDEELDQKKRNYNGLPDFMTSVARQELSELSEDVTECKVIYLPQLGYLLAIPMSSTMERTKDYSRPGLEFVFMSNVIVYYKSSKTKELDHLLGDTQNEIIDQEMQIMLRLQNSILENSNVLTEVTKYGAQLDCLLAMAMVAKEFNYVRPEMSDQDLIYIEKGRHPLQELCVSSFVANTTSSGGQSGGKVKLLTGPNASGKSVYLKQVALIVFMAHIGSFVPAQSAKVGHVDAIYTRIHTLESVSVGLSTFMIDLNQISFALRSATSRSLVIVDEFGKGTSAVDGMALLASCLDHWVSRIELCPHLFIATHIYGVLKLLSHREQRITFQTMETSLNNEEVVYLYQLTEGRASNSYAHWVALQAGLSRSVVDRGLQITKCVCESKPIPTGNQQGQNNLYLRYSEIVNNFMKIDLNSESEVQKFLNDLKQSEKDDDDNNEHRNADISENHLGNKTESSSI